MLFGIASATLLKNFSSCSCHSQGLFGLCENGSKLCMLRSIPRILRFFSRLHRTKC